MNACFFSIGSNLGNRLENLTLARNLIADRIGEINKVSEIYETEPWGFVSEQWFYNQVLKVATALSPIEIISIIEGVEKDLGRKKKSKTVYLSRIIDIDLLFFNQAIIQYDNLTIPHPRLHERRFVLQPLVDIEPEWNHPVFNKSVNQLLLECKDDCKIVMIKK